MVSQKVLVGSALGIHLRPAGAMCDKAIQFTSKVTMRYGEGKDANAKSVISILASGVKCGQEVEIIAEGEDEQEALKQVVAAFEAALVD